jgi:hypothetical protein
MARSDCVSDSDSSDVAVTPIRQSSEVTYALIVSAIVVLRGKSEQVVAAVAKYPYTGNTTVLLAVVRTAKQY